MWIGGDRLGLTDRSMDDVDGKWQAAGSVELGPFTYKHILFLLYCMYRGSLKTLYKQLPPSNLHCRVRGEHRANPSLSSPWWVGFKSQPSIAKVSFIFLEKPISLSDILYLDDESIIKVHYRTSIELHRQLIPHLFSILLNPNLKWRQRFQEMICKWWRAIPFEEFIKPSTVLYTWALTLPMSLYRMF